MQSEIQPYMHQVYSFLFFPLLYSKLTFLFFMKGMRGTVKNIVAQHGWKQLWGGLVPTLWRDVPFSAVYWTGYDYFSKSFKQSMGIDTFPFPLPSFSRLFYFS